MYRNLAYLSREQLVRLFTWDEDGNRVSYDVPYEPYLYSEVKHGSSEKTSVFNTKVVKTTFPNEYRRREAVEKLSLQEKQKDPDQRGPVRLFENVSTVQQFLIDRYWQENSKPEFSQHPIRVQFIDIETYSPGEFPVPEKANDVVNVITIYDSIDRKFYTWGLKAYTPKQDNVEYVHCSSERELLVCFIDFIRRDYPDILSGWNSEFFDIPYLINRIQRILGEDAAKRLSPVDVIYSRELLSQFGKYNTRWHIKGMSCVDYLDVYKRFTFVMRESYKLDDIAELELGEKKIDYGNTNLSALADDDWETFVDYNIQDVNLLVRMDEKLQYIELLRMLAYVGCTPFENAMGSLNVITGAAVIEARHNNKVAPTFIRDGSGAKYEGAYVGEPQRGFQDGIVSFDVNSLYPNIMISLNLSPETKMGKFSIDDDDKVSVFKEKGDASRVSKPDFIKVVKDLDLSISKANVLFTQKNKGIFPAIVDNFYKERVKIKKEMTKCKRELSKLEKDDPRCADLQLQIDRCNIRQFTIKIFINTVYGYFGNKHSPMGDPDISRSITLTGRAIILQSNKILSDYIQEFCGLTDDQIKAKSPIVYNDTDSVYITIKHITDKLGIPMTDKKGKVTKQVHKIVQDIEDHLNKKIVEWGENVLNSSDCRFMFKRESICDVGLFLQKKRYILRVLDDEGIAVNKFKYTGVEVVRTTMPKAIKPYVKKIIETMLLTKSYAETNKVLTEAYDVFQSLPLEDIAFTMGISKYSTQKRDDYGNVKEECDGFKTYKGMPIHVKSAYYYNLLLQREKLDQKYETVGAGDKVRYFYVRQPNRYGIKSFAYKYYFPEEFKDSIIPDTEMMFDKIIYSVIERLFESVEWRPKKPGEVVQTDLFDLLK